MRVPRTMVAVALGVASLPICVAAAMAQMSVPDSMTLAALRARLADGAVVRVTSGSGAQVLRDVRLDASGIASARWGPGAAARPALITTADAMPPPTPSPIAWSAVSRIETGRTTVGSSALKGLVVLGGLGALFWRFVPTGYDGGRGSPAAIIGVPAATGFALGGLLGARHYRWKTVYASTGDRGE